LQRYRQTVYACYLGYITQAIINNFAPLLFLSFQHTFGLTLAQVTLLITVNFTTQLIVDLLSARFVDRIGIRPCIAAAHLFAAIGLMGLALFPLFLSAFPALILADVLYAVGGGLIEVLISPIVEACPASNKAAAMSLLHSFYCWGQMGVILFSTLFLSAFGLNLWPVLACIWAILPLLNFIWFLKVPIAKLVEDGNSLTLHSLFVTPVFWILAGLMICAGACELGMSQWASAFAESGLHVSKTAGDLLGPCLFAFFMGSARVYYAKKSSTLPLIPFMIGCCILCAFAYLLSAFSPCPALALAGCALCGLSVGVLWPGTFSTASSVCPRGGTAMFALLALSGDLGCSGGPTLIGEVSVLLGGNLRNGMAVGLIFPLIMIILLMILYRMQTSRNENGI